MRNLESSDVVQNVRGQGGMYIATPYDMKSLTWTAMSPNSMVRSTSGWNFAKRDITNSVLFADG